MQRVAAVAATAIATCLFMPGHQAGQHQVAGDIERGAAHVQQMVHAQDHLTTAMMMADQAEEFLNIYRLLSSLLKKEDSE